MSEVKAKPNSTDEDPFIIENLDLLMDMDIIESEPDWDNMQKVFKEHELLEKNENKEAQDEA